MAVRSRKASEKPGTGARISDNEPAYSLQSACRKGALLLLQVAFGDELREEDISAHCLFAQVEPLISDGTLVEPPISSN